MGPFEATVIIVIVVAIASTVKNKQNLRYGRGEKADSEESGQYYDEPENKELQLEIMAMKKRIEALEAIVTDKNFDLRNEIDRL